MFFNKMIDRIFLQIRRERIPVKQLQQLEIVLVIIDVRENQVQVVLELLGVQAQLLFSFFGV